MKLTFDQEWKLVKSLLVAEGVPAEHAEMISSAVTQADFCGMYSHGLSRLTMYLSQYKLKGLNLSPDIHAIRDDKATLCLDMDNASGVVAVCTAYQETKKRAKEYGIAMTTGMNSSNFNVGNFYGWQAARDNIICVLVGNTEPSMAPWGGAERLIGTNPCMVAVPAGKNYPVIFDIATSTIAYGKLAAYRREDRELPDGWALDEEGNITNDPSKAVTLIPFGQHKGSGLAIVIDILSGILSGASYARTFPYDVTKMDLSIGEGMGFAMIIIDIEHFMDLDTFKKRMDEYISTLKGSKKMAGVTEILMPGEIELRNYEQKIHEEIEFPSKLTEEFQTIAEKLGVLNAGEMVEEYAKRL